MSGNPIDDAIECVLSYFPDEVVTHLANSQREFLLAMKSCAETCVDRAIQDIDAHVEGARQRRQRREQPDESGRATRVEVEEDDETTEGSAGEPADEPAGA